MYRIENVESRDAGKFICTLQTYPKQTLIVFLQVDGKRFIKQRVETKEVKIYWNATVHIIL